MWRQDGLRVLCPPPSPPPSPSPPSPPLPSPFLFSIVSVSFLISRHFCDLQCISFLLHPSPALLAIMWTTSSSLFRCLDNAILALLFSIHLGLAVTFSWSNTCCGRGYDQRGAISRLSLTRLPWEVAPEVESFPILDKFVDGRKLSFVVSQCFHRGPTVGRVHKDLFNLSALTCWSQSFKSCWDKVCTIDDRWVPFFCLEEQHWVTKVVFNSANLISYT